MDDTATLIAVFKNSLLYTTAGQVTAIMPVSADSPTLMLGCFALAVCILRRAQGWSRSAYSTVGASATAVEALRDLVLFLLDSIINLAVQIVSTLAGQLITTAVAGAESVVYSICGATIAVVLLWLLNKIVLKNLR